MTPVNKGVKRNQYIPPSFTLPLFPQLSSHLPSAPPHLYPGTPSRSCALSPSSVLHSFVRWPPGCHSGSGVGQKTNTPSHRRLHTFAMWLWIAIDKKDAALLYRSSVCFSARWLRAWLFEKRARRDCRQRRVVDRKMAAGEGRGGDGWGRAGRKTEPAVLNPRETTGRTSNQWRDRLKR